VSSRTAHRGALMQLDVSESIIQQGCFRGFMFRLEAVLHCSYKVPVFERSLLNSTIIISYNLVKM